VAEGRRTVGVIGGMGPEATVDFFAKLVAATPVEGDQDHLRVLIDNDPTVPDRTAAVLGAGPSPVPQLIAMARGLVAAGAELLVMPCNTAHAFEADIRAAVPEVPFVSLIDATADAVAAGARGTRSVGLLATEGTLHAAIYHDAFARRGVNVMVPDADEQRTVSAAIAAVKRGRATQAVRAGLIAVAERLAADGAGAIVTACTELPLLLKAGDVVARGIAVPVIASTDALVARTLEAASARHVDAVTP
jgi:aspartate racemase